MAAIMVNPKHPRSKGGWSVIDSKTGKILEGPFSQEYLAREAMKKHAESFSEHRPGIARSRLQ